MSLVHVDISKVVASVATGLPRRADLQRAVKGLGAAAMQKWKRLAQQGLRSTSRDYIAGLQIRFSETSGIIELEGMLPNMIELGWPGGDMREWMLKSKKAKMGKFGPYLAIPFRHGTPGTSGRNVGAAMPTSIYNVAKTLAPTVSRPGITPGSPGSTKWGERLHPGLPMSQLARKILRTKDKPWHATSIYQGMVRKEKTYENATQSSYQTFRTISTHTREPGKHWVHPGIKAKRFAPQVQKHVEKLAAGIIAAALGNKP